MNNNKKEEKVQEEDQEKDRKEKFLEAVNGLLDAVELAQRNGCYSFKESEEVFKHYRFFRKEK